MGPEVATQLITVTATLGGVVLTLLTNAFLERRRARDSRNLEAMRLNFEHAKWLRDERQKAYRNLSEAGEEVLQWFRDLPTLVESRDSIPLHEALIRWNHLRAELRKAFNQVALFGTDEVRTAALDVWRTGRNGGNDFFRAWRGLDEPETSAPLEMLRTVASHLGTAGDTFLDACRKDLQKNA
ncbi:hypothetical protein Pmi06nite_46040 [Planotetraspora mira]|uniref:Uncharacterized protein n=1 Tax=Planotetraspora mira TaxID=58121 RepID=A0A8J3X7N8_9ACTN|nr:hypothetical protein Pmi06nite_46040 [Planotetraspora mira]